MSGIKIKNQVYITEDYTLFRFMSDNRTINTNIKLREEIKDVGILSPVIVNEKYEIIDGQHRVDVAREVGAVIPFIIMSGAGKKEIMSINTTSKQWKLIDYVQSYANEGIDDYKRFLYLTQTYDIQVGTLASLAFETTSNHKPQEAVKNKQLQIKNYHFLVNFLDFLQTIIDQTIIPQSKGFTLSLYTLFRLKKFYPDRIIEKQGLISDRLRGVTKMGAITRILVDSYNHKLQEGSRNRINYIMNSKHDVKFEEEIKDDLK